MDSTLRETGYWPIDMSKVVTVGKEAHQIDGSLDALLAEVQPGDIVLTDPARRRLAGREG